MFYLASQEMVTQQSIAVSAKVKAKTMKKQQTQQTQLEKIYLINLEQHMQQVMLYCNQNDRQLFLRFPLMKKKYYFQSESIDFLFIVKRKVKYEVFVFDLAVGSYGVQDKIKAAKKYLERLISSKQNTFIFHHYILCPKEKCSKRIIISDTVSIRFASVDDFKIENSRHKTQKFIMEELQKVNVLIRDRLG